MQEARKAVARLLRVQGLNLLESAGASAGSQAEKPDRPAQPHTPRPKPKPLQLHEPPTYIKIVWDDKKDITFYPDQRRYIRIETDAESNYHNANNPSASRINLIVSSADLAFRGSTPLQGGRMRALFDCLLGARLGGEGTVRVELSRPGLPVLNDERKFRIVEQPPAREDKKQIALPPFDIRPVDPDNPMWETLEWPDDVSAVASSAEMEEGGVHVVYYSTVFPKFKTQYDAFERSDPVQAASFQKRYGIWVTVHSLLYQHQQDAKESAGDRSEAIAEMEARGEREERVRMATLAAVFADREVRAPEPDTAGESE